MLVSGLPKSMQDLTIKQIRLGKSRPVFGPLRLSPPAYVKKQDLSPDQQAKNKQQLRNKQLRGLGGLLASGEHGAGGPESSVEDQDSLVGEGGVPLLQNPAHNWSMEEMAPANAFERFLYCELFGCCSDPTRATPRGGERAEVVVADEDSGLPRRGRARRGGEDEEHEGDVEHEDVRHHFRRSTRA